MSLQLGIWSFFGTWSFLRALVTKELFEVFPRCTFPRIRRFSRPDASNKLKIFAEIRHVLFVHSLGSGFAALLRDPRVIMRAIQTNLQIGPAPVTSFHASRLARQLILPAAFMAMFRHNLSR